MSTIHLLPKRSRPVASRSQSAGSISIGIQADKLGPHRGKLPVINLRGRTRGPSRFQKDLLISAPLARSMEILLLATRIYARSWARGISPLRTLMRMSRICYFYICVTFCKRLV